MESIIEAQNEAGFFDENMIFADFEKEPEIRATDFIKAFIYKLGDPDNFVLLDKLLASAADDEQKKLMAN